MLAQGLKVLIADTSRFDWVKVIRVDEARIGLASVVHRKDKPDMLAEYVASDPAAQGDRA